MEVNASDPWENNHPIKKSFFGRLLECLAIGTWIVIDADVLCQERKMHVMR